MNIKITSKDGITLKTQGKYCTEDIKINVGDEVGGGGATITKPSGWIGTAVPNSGMVEKVYLNTSLSVEEVVGLLDQLDYPSVEGMGGDRNYFLYSEDGTYQLGAIDYGDGYVIGNVNDNSAYFCTSESMSKYVGGFIGWNPDFNGEISINSNVLSTYLFNDYTYQIGAHNEQLSSLFSTTPFTQASGEQITLEGDYDGSTLVLDELPKGGWNGTPVPNSGYVENIYINTALSVEEITSIMNNFFANANPDAIINQGDIINYLVAGIATDTKMKVLAIILNDGLLNIQYVNIPFVDGQQVIENAEQIAIMINGEWNPEFVGPLNFNDEVVNTLNNALCGSDNDLLVSLFSTTPFTQTKPNTIDVKALIEQKKIPLAIEVKQEGILYQKMVLTKDYDNNGTTTFGVQLTDKQRELLDYCKPGDLNLNKFIIFNLKVQFNGTIIKQSVSQISSTTSVSESISGIEVWFNDYFNNLVCQCRFFINDDNLLYLEFIRGGSTPQESFTNDLTSNFLSLIEELELYIPNI